MIRYWNYCQKKQISNVADSIFSQVDLLATFVELAAGNNPLTTPQVGIGDYLFNLDDDPGELVNIADQYPEKVKELTELLELILEHPENSLNN